MATQFNYMILLCKDCGEEFVFTAAAQEYFESKGLTHTPKRCRFCHIEAKKRQRVSAPESLGADSGIQQA